VKTINEGLYQEHRQTYYRVIFHLIILTFLSSQINPIFTSKELNYITRRVKKINVPANITPVVQDLYQRTITAMFEATMGKSKISGGKSVSDWICQTEMAGELLNHPALFGFANGLLEQSYAEGIKLGMGRDKFGNQINETYEVAKAVIAEMGKHPALRQRAMELIFNPRTYYFQDIYNISDLNKVVSLLLIGIEISSASGPSGEGSSQNLPVERREVSIYDPELIKQMLGLFDSLTESIGDSDLDLSQKLIDARIKLGELYREVKIQKGYGELDFIFYAAQVSQAIEALSRFPRLLPKLVELAKSNPSGKQDKGDALLKVAKAYIEFGQMDKAFELFMQVEEVGSLSSSTIAQITAVPEYREEALKHVRKIGGEITFEILIDTGDELRKQNKTKEGEKLKEAEELYQEAWNLSSGTDAHKEHIPGYFIRIARESNIKFGELGANELLEYAQKEAISQIEKLDFKQGLGTSTLFFAQDTIFELARAGRYNEAEALTELVDQKFRIEWEQHLGSSTEQKPKDECYEKMAIAAAQRNDMGKTVEYLGKISNYDTEHTSRATLEIAKILARRGDYNNALGAAVTGEAIFEVGRIMLEHNLEIEKVGKVFVEAAKIGLNYYTLEKLLDTIRQHQELKPYLLDILNNALVHDASYYQSWMILHRQQRVILGALREFFPELVQFVPNLPI